MEWRGRALGREEMASASSVGSRSRASVTCGVKWRGSGASPSDQRLLDAVAQRTSSGSRSTPTQRARGWLPPNTPMPASCNVKRRALTASQRLVDIGRDILGDLADEAQGQVEVAGIDPPGAGSAVPAATVAASVPAETRSRQTGAASSHFSSSLRAERSNLARGSPSRTEIARRLTARIDVSVR